MPLTARRRVLDVAPPMRWEAGLRPELGYRPKRAAVLAHWSDRAEVSKSVVQLARQLVAHDYDVILASAAQADGPLVWPSGQFPEDRVGVYRRANIGYDFGTWAQTFQELPGLLAADHLVVLNDSMVGPFRPLTGLVRTWESDPHPVWGLVDTTQDRPHLQSHFVVYKGGVLESPRLRRFWRDVRVEPTKQELIRRYEIGQSVVLRRAKITYGVGFSSERVVNYGGNPTSPGWRRLLRWGFPFIKRELLLRPPPEVPDAADIPRVVRQLFGQDVWEWV